MKIEVIAIAAQVIGEDILQEVLERAAAKFSEVSSNGQQIFRGREVVWLERMTEKDACLEVEELEEATRLLGSIPCNYLQIAHTMHGEEAEMAMEVARELNSRCMVVFHFCDGSIGLLKHGSSTLRSSQISPRQ